MKTGLSSEIQISFDVNIRNCRRETLPSSNVQNKMQFWMAILSSKIVFQKIKNTILNMQKSFAPLSSDIQKKKRVYHMEDKTRFYHTYFNVWCCFKISSLREYGFN